MAKNADVIKTRVEKQGACRRIISVEVAEDKVGPEYEKILDAYVSEAKIPGFRKGKAPTELIEKKFQTKIIEDAKDRLVPIYCREACVQEKVSPVAILAVEEVKLEKGAPFTFSFTLDIPPEFRTPKYKKLTVRKQKSEVSGDDVQKTLDRIKDSASRFDDVDNRGVKDGDLVKIDYAGTSDGTPVGEIAPGCAGIGEGKDFMALMSEPEFLPGFSTGLIGTGIGETKMLSIEFPNDHHIKEMAGRKAEYEVTVKGIREKQPPEMNEEFLKNYEVDSEQALREKIRDQLSESAVEEERQRIRNELSQQLIKGSKIEIPDSQLQDETRATAQNIIRENAMRGIPQEEIEKHKDEILSEATRASVERIKLGYILTRVADEEKVEIEDAVIGEHMKSLAARYGMTVDRLKGELEKRNSMDRIRNDIRCEKALDFVVEHAKIK